MSIDLIQVRDFVLEALLPQLKCIIQNNIPTQINQKASQDFVTNIDIESEQFLVKAISEKFPDHQILSEESFQSSSSVQGYYWMVDPLDGTSNLIAGIPFYCVSIALLRDGEPVVSVIYDVNHNEIFDAVSGMGARLNQSPITNTPSNKDLAIAISSGTVDLLLRENISFLQTIRQIAKIRTLGSQALQLAYVACGRLRANISMEAKPWDDAAGALILKESFCYYSKFDGSDIFPMTKFSTDGLQSVACSSKDLCDVLHDNLCKMVAKV